MTLISDARGPGAASGGGEFDRTPPQAIEAEQSVLGAMMLSKDAIADVVEVIKPGDFYRPAHQLVYDAVLDLYARGEPADAVTVSAELTSNGQLNRVGGATYLHTLISMVPTAANAGYYAAIVADRATLRRLVTAGTRIVQMGYDASSGNNDVVGSVDDVVDRAQAEIYDVTERRTAEDYVHIETLLQSTLDEIEKISSNGGIGTGIPTGFQQLDEITNGLHPGQMVTVAGRPGSGKALALDTPLPTPTGWTTMGDVGSATCCSVPTAGHASRRGDRGDEDRPATRSSSPTARYRRRRRAPVAHPDPRGPPTPGRRAVALVPGPAETGAALALAGTGRRSHGS